MSIAQQTVGTSATTLYTSVNGSAITAIYLMNDHASDVTVSVHVVVDGASATASNKIIKDFIIAPADTYIIDTERLILDNNDTIQAIADTGAVLHATISYIGV
jgi:hypothetical protein